jgi:hypothetical protein
MPTPTSSLHRVAVVRVEIREATSGDMVIRLLEVRRGRDEDALLGVVQNPDDACAVLLDWLAGLGGGGGGRLPATRRPVTTK